MEQLVQDGRGRRPSPIRTSDPEELEVMARNAHKRADLRR